MAKVTAKATKLEPVVKAYMHTDSGNIAFPMGHFDTAAVLVYCAKQEILKTCSSNWGMFKRDNAKEWVPLYDGETLTIVFGQE